MSPLHRLLKGGILAVACTLLALACDPGRVCGCTPVMPDLMGTFRGRVFTPDSIPVVYSRVEITGGVGTCESDGAVQLNDGLSGTSGNYVAYFEAYDVEDDFVCVTLRAYSSSALQLAPSEAITRSYGPDEYEMEIEEVHDFYLTQP